MLRSRKPETLGSLRGLEEMVHGVERGIEDEETDEEGQTEDNGVSPPSRETTCENDTQA